MLREGLIREKTTSLIPSMEKNDVVMLVFMVGITLCVAWSILMFVRPGIILPPPDGTYLDVVRHVDPTTGLNAEFKVRRYIDKGPGWVRFETVDGSVFLFDGPICIKEK